MPKGTAKILNSNILMTASHFAPWPKDTEQKKCWLQVQLKEAYDLVKLMARKGTEKKSTYLWSSDLEEKHATYLFERRIFQRASRGRIRSSVKEK